jgi:hypothetical protein
MGSLCLKDFKMEYTTVSNPQWADVAHTCIQCIVNFTEFGPSPFGAHPNDIEPHGKEIYQRCINGEFGPVAEYIPPPPPTDAEKASFIRFLRDQALSQSDWTDTLSAQTRLGTTVFNQWQVYRQALRDFPQQPNFPNNGNLPQPPVSTTS